MTTPSCDLFLDRLEQNVSKYANKTAITYLASGPNGGKVEKVISYSDLQSHTDNLANVLLESGLTRGDRAVLVYPPSTDYMIAFLACLKAGIIAVPVFPPNPARPDTISMFSKIVEGCDAQYALTSASYNHLKTISGIKESFSRFKRTTATPWPESLQWIVTNLATKPKRTSSSFTKLTANNLAFLQYTSGSTSAPKGVMITHANLAHNLTIITNELKAKDDTVVVSWLPQYHDMGLIGSYLGVLYCGGCGYYMSPLSFLQRPMLWIEAISKFRATHLQAPNFAFKLTARKCEVSTIKDQQLDLSSVRHVINAAEPVTDDSIQAFDKAFGKFGFGNVMFPTYGLAEHTVFVCSGGKQRLVVSKQELEGNGRVVIEDDASHVGVSRLIGCGLPSSQNVDVRIVDRDSATEVGEDKVGEIWVRSPSKAAGYYNMPEETREDFYGQIKGVTTGGGTYLRTGDLGFMHNDELFICGRLKDLIIVGGRNYYPQDIEATAESSSESLRPGCSAAFTIDPNQAGGEEVALIHELRAVPQKDVNAFCEQIVDGIRGAINQEHSLGISHIVLVKPKTILKTTSGKIARSWCRKAFIDNSLEVVYKKSFKEGCVTVESELSSIPAKALNQGDIDTLRAMSTCEILVRLRADTAKMGSVAPDNVGVDQPLATILDSLTLSQFKGLLEAEYAVKLSDEYLFRESTNLTKLVEVVRLGYAPDDGDIGAAATLAANPQGQGGVAEALGCPPGVVCCIIL